MSESSSFTSTARSPRALAASMIPLAVDEGPPLRATSSGHLPRSRSSATAPSACAQPFSRSQRAILKKSVTGG